jgi:hypothetical protein
MAWRDTEIDKLLIAGRIAHEVDSLAAVSPEAQSTFKVNHNDEPPRGAKPSVKRQFAGRRRRSQNA